MPVHFVDPGDLAWADPRGWGMRPFEAAGSAYPSVGDVHVVSVGPGAVRGNHRHPNVTEWMLLFGAPLVLAWRGPDGTEGRASVAGDEPVLVEIPPGVDHAVRGEGPGVAYLVSWADGVPELERAPPLL